ncbi:Protein translocase subunit SecA [Dissostichus eleginoides]|uniref:Protein translocase subunit SecA n=1 Tax=Dissostichus eleginoides TaxID=100907 RepID=A0AAD9BVW4_DISEL|nr:Protein translocase subunit SecA [Dissostichus eleginoides]
MLRTYGRLNKLPPLKPPDSWERQPPIPQRTRKRCRTTRNREGGEKKSQWRGKKATTVGCPTQLPCRDDVRGHVTRALQ